MDGRQDVGHARRLRAGPQGLAAWTEPRASPRPVTPAAALDMSPGCSQAGGGGHPCIKAHRDGARRAPRVPSHGRALGRRAQRQRRQAPGHGQLHCPPPTAVSESPHEPASTPPRGTALRPEEGAVALASLGDEQTRSHTVH